MSALDRRISPPTVAPVPGKEREKLLQRWQLLTPENRKSLLDSALYKIEAQESAKLTDREREIDRLIGQIETTLELIRNEGGTDSIKDRVWRALVPDFKARLAALGVDYFENAGADRVVHRSRPVKNPAPVRVLTDRQRRAAASEAWRREIRRVYAADHKRSAASYDRDFARDEGTEWERAVATAAANEAFARYVDAVDRQMAMPAVALDHIRWKQKLRALDGGRPAWDAAIARDAAEIANWKAAA